MITLQRDKVGIIPIDDPEKIGHIIIPDIAKERCDQGIVKYVGPDVKFVEIGMYVIFSGYSGTLISISGEGRLIIMPEEFIVAEIKDIPATKIPGLYFSGYGSGTREKDGEYFEASYELAMNFIAKALSEAPWWRGVGGNGKRAFDVRSRRPDVDEYNKLRGG